MRVNDQLGKDAEKKIKEWLDVPGYEDCYAVSSEGDVLSKERKVLGSNGRLVHVKEKLLTPQHFDTGYVYVVLTKSGKSKNALLHRIVASAFLPNPSALPEVNHIDGNKDNNSVHNLEWCTPEQNIHHALKCGLMSHSSQEHMKKMAKARGAQLSKSIRCIETDEVYPSIVECAKQMGIRVGYIYEYMRGDAKSCHGYHFEVVEDK